MHRDLLRLMDTGGFNLKSQQVSISLYKSQKISMLGKNTNQKGRIGLSGLIFILIVASIVYTGWRLIPPWIRYYQFNNYLSVQILHAEKMEDEEIRGHILGKSKELNLPIQREDIRIIRDGKNISISITYQENVTFLGRFQQRFIFTPKATKTASGE